MEIKNLTVCPRCNAKTERGGILRRQERWKDDLLEVC